MITRTTRGAGCILAALALTFPAAGSGGRPCPPDVDCSGAVDVVDLVQVVTDWGGAGGASDINGSGVVEVGDLVEVILAWGPCVFQFAPPQPDPEAEQIALEMLGPQGALLYSMADYQRVERDLDLIRAAVPALQGQTHTPAWAPDRLIVQLSQTVPPDAYPCVNAFYQSVGEQVLFSFGGFDWVLVTLAGNINVEALAVAYSRLPEVGVAEPDGLIGGQNFWTPTPMDAGVWRWDIDDGWHDCFDGCDCHRVYVIETDLAGNVTVLDVDEFGQPWCDF
jgi:hypothetical protein